MENAKSPLGSSTRVQLRQLVGVTLIGELVLVADQRVQATGLTEQVEADVAERDVELDLRRTSQPLAAAVRQDQRVVSQPNRLCTISDHRCSTPSGTS